ncbi:Glycosyltransferase, GT2 family [Sulfurivirga caldicuralii]|uniref:Glycosyltransferase, GT2 family n=1 Tax=Sulfurivirga caldicuralii TaxID=364032 RepID=A0A1N6H5H7_9GAMM|nr:glycosyltransferase [Sulfurivirga caldicuralii]SIO15068.1 Glycosyltransferase, GT2 family [Sulfurivirga caldicuralii]
MTATSCTIVPVVVTHNRIKSLQGVMDRLLAQPFAHLVVVDNASTDGSGAYLDALAQTDRRVHVLHLPENTGGAGGFYAGVRYAHENLHYDYLLFQDDDAWPESNVVEQLCRRHDRPDAVIAAVYYPNGQACPMNIPGYHPFKGARQTLRTLLRGAKGFHVTPSDYATAQPQPVDFASFVGLFVHRRVIEAVGYPDARWFLYGDDLEYTLRIRSKGFRLEFDPRIRYVHDCHTLQDGKKIYRPLWKAYFTYRNNLQVARQVAGGWYPLVVLYRLVSWHVAMLRYPVRDWGRYLRYTWRALGDALLQRWPTLEQIRDNIIRP